MGARQDNNVSLIATAILCTLLHTYHSRPILLHPANSATSHGRDNNLRIWQLRASDENSLSTILPAEQAPEQRPKPWLLHTLPVNTLNFCAFSVCYELIKDKQQLIKASWTERSAPETLSSEPVLIAVPARDDKKIEVYQFPDERLKFIVPRAQSTDTGMVMAVKLVHHPTSNNVLVLSGYEGGLTAVHSLPQNKSSSALDLAQLVYLSQPHTQPVLSLDVSPDVTKYFTSSADAIIAAHRIPELPSSSDEEEDYSAFDQGNSTLSSSPSTAKDQAPNFGKVHGFEANQPPSPSTPQEEAPEALEFSKRSVPSASTISPLSFTKQPISSPEKQTTKPAGLSSLLSSAPPQARHKPSPPPAPIVTMQPAYKTIDTKHAGQQSLLVRSDGRLLVTGGWDARIRIYSMKSLKEVAVLKWHKEGVYAVGFGEVLDVQDLRREEKDAGDEGEGIIKRETGLGKLQRQREEQLRLKHWVVAGAKDGKVSLWEVF